MAKNRRKYKSYTISFRVPEKLYLQLLEESEKEQVPVSELIRDVLKQYLKKKMINNFISLLPVSFFVSQITITGNYIITGNDNIISSYNNTI